MPQALHSGPALRILGLSGSLREQSSNARLIEAASLCAPAGLSVVPYGLGRLPLFNPDLEGTQPPAPVIELRETVGASAGLLICSPEYARGVSGVMKNALDWLVGAVEFPGKPVALVNASQRATDADAHLRLTLRTMNARLVERASVTVPLLGRNEDAEGLVAVPALRAQITAALEALRVAISDAGG